MTINNMQTTAVNLSGLDHSGDDKDGQECFVSFMLLHFPNFTVNQVHYYWVCMVYYSKVQRQHPFGM